MAMKVKAVEKLLKFDKNSAGAQCYRTVNDKDGRHGFSPVFVWSKNYYVFVLP